MREDAFRAFAASKLKPNVVNSYLANCRHVERITGHDLTDVPLDDNAVRASFVAWGMQVRRRRG